MARIRPASLAVVLLLAARGAADEAVWIGPAVGASNVPANWSTGVVPGSNTSALIDDNPAQSTRVESRVNVSSTGMTGIDSGDTLAVINSSFGTSRALVLDGTVSLEGSIAQFSAALVTNPGSELKLAATNATATTIGLFNREATSTAAGF
jgi:hypothetical protein